MARLAAVVISHARHHPLIALDWLAINQQRSHNMPNNPHRAVLVALRDWFAARQDGSEQAAAAALLDRLDLLPPPFTAAARPGHTLAESAILNALDAALQAGPNQPAATDPPGFEPAGWEDIAGRR